MARRKISAFDHLSKKLEKTIGLLTNKRTKRSERVKRTSRLFSECMRFLDRETEDGVICGPRCSMCCHRMPYIRSWMEEDYIFNVIDDLVSSAVKSEIREVVRTVRTAWHDTCSANGENPLHPVAPLDIEIEWAGTYTGCPLLDESGLCVIYPRTPLDCRMSLKIKEACMTPLAIPINPVTGFRITVVELCHKIDKKLGKSYRAKPLIEVLHRWATK